METSGSGSPIYRYPDGVAPFEPPTGDFEHLEQISDHIKRHIGPVKWVFHELISDKVHIDVHIVAPSAERPFYTLITSGMSDRPMNAPEGSEHHRYSELMLCLPDSWPMSHDDWKDEAFYWPVRILKFLAGFPHHYRTWLWMQHTVPNGNPAKPFARNTDMCCVILMPPLTAPREFYELRIDDEKTIHFHSAIPIHADEMALKLEKGSDALMDRFELHGVTEFLNPFRRSSLLPLAPEKKPWWKRLLK